MDAVADKIALIFAGNEPFDILAGPNRTIPVPAGTHAQRLAALAAFKNRRDDLGTTHHDAGTMRMGDNIADAVTNDFGRIHDTTNCYCRRARTVSRRSARPTRCSRASRSARRTGDLLNHERAPRARPGGQPAARGRLPAAVRRHGGDVQELAAGGSAPAAACCPHQWRDGELRRSAASAVLLRDASCSSISRCACSSASSTRRNHNSGVFVRFPASDARS